MIQMRYGLALAGSIISLSGATLAQQTAPIENSVEILRKVERITGKDRTQCLLIERGVDKEGAVLSQVLPYFQYSANPEICSEKVPEAIYKSEMVLEANAVNLHGSDIQVTYTIDDQSLCITFFEASGPTKVLEICPESLKTEDKRISLASNATHGYGLGQQFVTPGNPDGDWVEHGERRSGEFGNIMEGFDNAFAGNTQFPILYGFTPEEVSFALFLDSFHKQTWDFKGTDWQVSTGGEDVRFTVFFDKSLLELRKMYMALTGKSPVPPRKAFGLWVSEYGYDDWAELDMKLDSLRKNEFPIDGFVMDLQWFGGISPGSPDSRMGALTWDEDNFPFYKEKIERLYENHIELMLIEEPFISKNLEEYQALADQDFLARDADGNPVNLSSWWGQGGYVDFSNPEAGDFWFDYRRLDLIKDGIFGHWTDLGEPENYDPQALYHGIPALGLNEHDDVHNLYNFWWHKSIADGYERNNLDKRLFLMSRSGAPGLQRFGASMWSGDVASRLSSLATHNNAQMHMSFSGIDYYGSDIAGFRRETVVENIDEVYTRWFANSVWTDVPVRPHTENLCNCRETSPDRIGDMKSNLFNISTRYRLIPYYYSIAHQSYETGAPFIGPMVMYFQDDPEVARIGGQKMLGRDLMIVTEANSGTLSTNAYLPKGEWFNYRSGDYIKSEGIWLENLPLYENGVFRLPIFARAGAIIPTMEVDGTTDAFGAYEVTKLQYGLDVFEGKGRFEFDVIEDDGRTNAYKSGKKIVTKVEHILKDQKARIKIHKVVGEGVDSAREYRIAYHSKGYKVRKVIVNGLELGEVLNVSALESLETGWVSNDMGIVTIKTGSQQTANDLMVEISFRQKVDNPPPHAYFVCDNVVTEYGQYVRVVGNIPQLGNWDAGRGLELAYTPHGSWVEVVGNLPANKEIEWKCVIDNGNATYYWEQGENNKFTTNETGFQGILRGRF